ncbi:MAG: SPASM domain-containing protein [Planctomycetota bacterium]
MGGPQIPRLPVSPILKPAGSACNCACGYCFYRPGAPAPARMSPEILERVTAEILRVSTEPIFNWQGGEPTLMGVDFFRRAIELQKGADKGKPAFNAIQTNGMLIDDEWASFFAENGFLAGVSLDGPEDVHNAFRKRPDGRGTWQDVIRAVRILQRHDAELNILTVVGKHNVERHGDLWRLLRAYDLRFVQLIPCLRHGESGEILLPNSPSPEALARFYCRLFDLWMVDLRKNIYTSVQLFDHVVRTDLNQPPALCVFAPSCFNQIVVESDGSVYPCDWYVLPEWRLGNVMQTDLDVLLGGELNRSFQERSRKLSSRCRGCEFLRYCFGGCPLHRSADGTNYFCETYIRFFEHARPRLAELARSSGPSRAQAAKPRGGDPCPCGSGRKYRKCCGRPASLRPA